MKIDYELYRRVIDETEQKISYGDIPEKHARCVHPAQPRESWPGGFVRRLVFPQIGYNYEIVFPDDHPDLPETVKYLKMKRREKYSAARCDTLHLTINKNFDWDDQLEDFFSDMMPQIEYIEITAVVFPRSLAQVLARHSFYKFSLNVIKGADNSIETYEAVHEMLVAKECLNYFLIKDPSLTDEHFATLIATELFYNTKTMVTFIFNLNFSLILY